MRIDALGPDGPYQTRNREIVTTTAGVTVAELSLVPPLYVSRTIIAQRKTRPLPAGQREAALAKAADAFATGVIAGLDFDGYAELASRISGVPITVTRSGARSVADGVASAFSAAQQARPTGAVLDWRDERTRDGAAVWVRRGKYSGCWLRATARVCTGCGRRHSRLATGWRSARRAASRSPRTGWFMRRAKRAFARRT